MVRALFPFAACFLVLTACAGRIDEGIAPSELAAPPPASTAAPASTTDASIRMLRVPDSHVALGTRVHVGGPAVRVTAIAGSRVWIQEAADEGGCEIGEAVVAWRAISIMVAGTAPALTIGQNVEVEGTLGAIDSRRAIVDATIVAGEKGTPYGAHCERDVTALRSPALDDVLVLTGGVATSGGLDVCFGEGSVSRTVRVTSDIHAVALPAPGYAWMGGILDVVDGERAIAPREDDDVMWRGEDGRGNDVCL